MALRPRRALFLFPLLLSTLSLSAQTVDRAAREEIYRRLVTDPTYLAYDQALHERGSDPQLLATFLEFSPLSPLDLWEIRARAEGTTIPVPFEVNAEHEQWVRLHPELARDHFGDAEVDRILGGTRTSLGIGLESGALAVSVGTNRNLSADEADPPDEYQGETALAVNPKNLNQIVVAANTWDESPDAACDNRRTQAIHYSTDGGVTWGYTCAPSIADFSLGTCSGTVLGADPALAWNEKNEVFLNYLLVCRIGNDTSKRALVVARSVDGGATWTKQAVVSSSWGAAKNLEDKNEYAVDTNYWSPNYKRHYACWDQLDTQQFFGFSNDNGVTWARFQLPAPPDEGFYGCDIAIEMNGRVHVAMVSEFNYRHVWHTSSPSGQNGTFSPPVLIDGLFLATEAGIPAQEHRGIYPFASIGVDNSGGPCAGTLYVAYPEHGQNQTAADTDIWVSRSVDHGATWNWPVKVNDDGLANRAQFNPSLAVDQKRGRVFVTWYDTREHSGAKRVGVYGAQSIDCGVSFEANQRISQPSGEFNESVASYSNENLTDNPKRNVNQYGEYLGLEAHDGRAFVAWTDSRHFFPGNQNEPQKENAAFSRVDFSHCGNGFQERVEVCDGTDLLGQTCASLGYAGGTLGCSPSCRQFDFSGCLGHAFPSQATEDGYIVEFMNSGFGVQAVADLEAADAIQVGDTDTDNQLRGFVSFDTSSIPDGATLQQAILRLRLGKILGNSPFGTHGSLVADIGPVFGPNSALVYNDFQAAAQASAVCQISQPPMLTGYTYCTLNAAGLAAIDKTGRTQLRLRFTTDDDDDQARDMAGFYAEWVTLPNSNPQLVVVY
jgi:hypothetical protein